MPTTLTNTTLIGLEQVQRAAFFTVLDGLNANIGVVQTYMNSSDQEFATRVGVTYAPTIIELVANANFHEGHRPSLISAPVSEYPNVSVTGNRATPSAENNSFDQLDSYRDTLAIEVMVKSIESESEINRRVRRTAEAINITIMQDPTLGGVVNGVEAPTVMISDVFTRKERTAYGPHWFWQGARVEYGILKEAVQPPSSGVTVYGNFDQS